MARRPRILLLGLALVAVTWVTPTEQVAAKTDVTVDGATVTLTVPIDILGGLLDDGREYTFRNIATRVVVPVTKVWADAATNWNDAFATLSYKGCVNFKLDLQFYPKRRHATPTPGHHPVFLYNDPDLRPVVFDPATKDAAEDTTSAFTTDLKGVWGIEDADGVSHEVGHLLGLGDDYTDVKDANGKVTGSKPNAGRENTLMAGGENVDQNLVDRIGKLVENAGRTLPKCWTGTMTSSSNETITADNVGLVCSGTWTTALSLTIADDGKVTGTAVATLDGPPTCPRGHGGTPYTQMEVFHALITGTATDTELRIHLGTASSYEPAGSADFTALTATIYGADPSGTTFTVPITAPGHAQGEQPLQYVVGVNSSTSENAITLVCQTC